MNSCGSLYKLAPSWAQELGSNGLVTFQELEALLTQFFGRDTTVYVSRLPSLWDGQDEHVFHDDGIGSPCVNVLPDGTLGIFYWGWGEGGKHPTDTPWVLKRELLAFPR